SAVAPRPSVARGPTPSVFACVKALAGSAGRRAARAGGAAGERVRARGSGARRVGGAAGGEQGRAEGGLGAPEERRKGRSANPVAERGLRAAHVAHAHHQDRAVESRELGARGAGEGRDHAVEELLRLLAVSVVTERELGGELEGI